MATSHNVASHELEQFDLGSQRSFVQPPASGVHTARPAENSLGAWLKVLGCFFVFWNTWGLASSFGVYQAYYESELLSHHSPSTISWIGTTQVFLLGLTGILAGPLYDRGYSQVLLAVGFCLVVFGLFMVSISTEFYQLLLAQGFCNGLTYVPAVSVVNTTFTTKRPLATGLSASGSAISSTLFPIMFRQLMPLVGFGWVNRILGFMFLVTSTIAYILLKQETTSLPTRRQTFFDARALTEPAFILLCLGLFFVELGYWIPPFSLPPYAQFSLNTSATFAANLLAIMNAGGLAGRILPAFLAQIFGPAWVLVGGVLSLGVLVLAWLGIHNVPGITAWGVLVGFMAGIAVSLPNALVPKLSPMSSVVGARTGMMWFFAAFASLIGSPIAGLLIDTEENDYQGGKIFSGTSICLGAALLCVPAIRVTKDARRSE